MKELRCAGLRVGKSLEGSKLFGLSRQVGHVGKEVNATRTRLSVKQENGVLIGLGQRGE